MTDLTIIHNDGDITCERLEMIRDELQKEHGHIYAGLMLEILHEYFSTYSTEFVEMVEVATRVTEAMWWFEYFCDD